MKYITGKAAPTGEEPCRCSCNGLPDYALPWDRRHKNHYITQWIIHATADFGAKTMNSSI